MFRYFRSFTLACILWHKGISQNYFSLKLDHHFEFHWIMYFIIQRHVLEKLFINTQPSFRYFFSFLMECILFYKRLSLNNFSLKLNHHLVYSGNSFYRTTALLRMIFHKIKPTFRYFQSAAEGQRPFKLLEQLSMYMFTFCLIYALSTPTTVLSLISSLPLSPSYLFLPST